MRILAVDTASVSASVATLEDGALRSELTVATGQTHARHLMKMIDDALALSSWTLNAVDGFAVTLGPGSFTGLRIGISTVKGLSMATGKPAAGVSSLQALAYQCAFESMAVCALLDGRRGEVYCARYHLLEGHLVPEGQEAILPPADVVREIDEHAVFTGSGARLYADLFKNRLGDRALFAPPGSDLIRASTVARLALPQLQRKDSGAAQSLMPRYIRKPDAEISSQNKIFV